MRSLLHIFPGFGTGGSQMRLAALAEIWQDRVTHDIYAIDGDYSALTRFSDKVKVQAVNIPYIKGAFLKNVKAFRAFIRNGGYDAVNTYNWGSIEAAVANTPQIVRHIHNEDGFGADEAQTFKKRRIYTRRLALSGKTVILPSKTLHHIAQTIWRPFDARLEYVPNGVAIPEAETLARYVKGSESDPFAAFRREGNLIIGTVATLRPEKALHVLINAVGLLIKSAYPVKLALIGDGPELAFLQNYVHAIGMRDHVLFTGRRDDAATAFLPYFDIFAMSSLTEQQPLSLLEASALKTPVAATEAGDVTDMLSEENKPFVTEQKMAALYAALKTLCENPDLRARLGAANRQKAQADYSLEQCAEKRFNLTFPQTSPARAAA